MTNYNFCGSLYEKAQWHAQFGSGSERFFMELGSNTQEFTAGFPPLKVFLSIGGDGVNCHDIRLLHAQPEFYAAFGYSPTDLPMSLAALLCDGDRQDVAASLVSALLAGMQGSFCIRLIDRSRVAVPCHVTISTGGFVTRRVSTECSEINRRFAILSIQGTSALNLPEATTVVPLVSLYIPPSGGSQSSGVVDIASTSAMRSIDGEEEVSFAELPPAKKCRSSAPDTAPSNIDGSGNN
jgi:hypothetical protein